MLSLAISILVIFISLMLPGTLLNASLTKDATKAICLAPATSIALLSIFAIVNPRLGIWTQYSSLMIELGCVALGFLVSSAALNRHTAQNSITIKKKELCCLVLFFTISAIIAAYVFLTVLDGPDCYFQAWDNQTHLRKIRAFVETGNYSSFNSQFYKNALTAPEPLANSFYPSAWHLLAAMLVSLLDIPVTQAANAVNILCVGTILPLTLFLCLQELGIKKRSSLALCAIICLGVPIYPWDLISYGPLYPNLLGFCLLPGEISLFFSLFNKFNQIKLADTLKGVILLFLGLISLALAHPNTVFAWGFILAPYLISRFKFFISAKYRNIPSIACYAIPLAAIFLIWISFTRIPFMHEIVDCYWPAFTSVPKALLSALFLGTTTHPIQILIPLLTFIGVYIELKDRKFCLAATYGLLVIFYTIDAGSNLPVKPLLTGFWYNDYHRVSAMLGLISIFLACLAINRIFVYLEDKLSEQKTSVRTAIAGVIAAGMIALIFYPSIPLPRKHELQTAFGYEINEMRNQFDKELIYYDLFSPLEEDFCKTTLAKYNSDNSVVINNPDDGSIFAYGVYGSNMYYRYWYPPAPDTETKESKVIRHHLNEIASNENVRNAVKQIGAKYVIQLDHGEPTQEYRIQYNYDNADEWRGIDLIDETTPGFTLVASNDDIRLYKIDLNI